MSSAFAINLPVERAFERRVLFAVDLIDAVTLETVTRNVEVVATGLKGKPIINCGGSFVWLEEGNAQPQQVIVDTANAPYESVTVPAPVLPARTVRIELAPTYDYPFVPGVTAMRGTLLESRTGIRIPVAGVQIWLQWIDDTAGGTTWIDAPTRCHTSANGDFAVLLRFTPEQVPKPGTGGGLSVRLRANRQGNQRTSTQFTIPEGRVADALPPFAWDELVP